MTVTVPNSEDYFKIELASTQNRALNRAAYLLSASVSLVTPCLLYPCWSCFLLHLPPPLCSPLLPTERYGWSTSLFNNSKGPSSTHPITFKISLAEFQAFHFPGHQCGRYTSPIFPDPSLMFLPKCTLYLFLGRNSLLLPCSG